MVRQLVGARGEDAAADDKLNLCLDLIEWSTSASISIMTTLFVVGNKLSRAGDLPKPSDGDDLMEERDGSMDSDDFKKLVVTTLREHGKILSSIGKKSDGHKPKSDQKLIDPKEEGPDLWYFNVYLDRKKTWGTMSQSQVLEWAT